MSRAQLTLCDRPARERAMRWIEQAPAGTRVIFKDSKRSTAQNDRMWAMLTDVATQKEHAGRRYTPDQWKVLFMHACGREVQFVPSLDNKTFIPWGQSSSDLSKREMTDLIEFIFAWGAENGVTFHDPDSLQTAPTCEPATKPATASPVVAGNQLERA
ncbi:recombination protein NinB [Bradyrhizobium tunisiense]|uniref:recombination protein NinB n=1 Tax=Bradyrhizobium tunisiense TaxID=3278709 RepID=UPI0035E0C339